LATAKIAHRAGAKVVLDPAPAAKPPAELLKLVHFIRPNSNEAEALTGIQVRNRRDARRAAHALFGRGVQAAAIQAGEEGDLVVWRDGEKLFPRLKVKSVDATGAGDAFAGAIAVALSEGKSFAEAGELANAAAALATTKFGAQTALPRRKEVLRLVRRGA
jgi:ribokinase